MSKVRGVRFSAEEELLIEQFLKINPVFDFSTLAKLAILEFVRKPHLHLKPVGSRQDAKGVKNVRPIS
jgi:hypothetical protein